MKKKILFFMLVCIGIFALGSISVSAETYGNLTYEIENGEVTIIRCKTSATEIEIPAEIDGLPVTTIDNYAFDGCIIERLIFSRNLQYVGEYAFRNCSIEIIDIQDMKSYLNCNYYNGAPISKKKYFKGKPLKKLNIEVTDNVAKIPQNAFCSSTLEIVAINCDISIERGAFQNCKNLKSVSINGCASVAEYSFFGCTSLESVYLKQATEIGTKAFEDCNLNKSFVISEGCVSIGEGAFMGSNLKDFVIPEGCVSIGEGAFSDVYLSTLTIPKSLERVSAGLFRNGYSGRGSVNTLYIDNIESYLNIEVIAYYHNGNRFTDMPFKPHKIYVNGEQLVNLTIPSTVKAVPDSAFRECQSLKSVNILNGVKTIGSYAFYNCKNLSDITIPSSITKINKGAFMECKALSKVNIQDIESWCTVDFSGSDPFSFDYGANLYLNDTLIKTLVIPDGITEIKDSVFCCGKSIETVVLPRTILEIGDYAFSDCKNIVNVYYNGTDNEWEEIFIGSNNDALTNSKRKTIYYITLIDDNGNTSSVTYLPGEKIKVSDIEKKYMHKITLYSDKAMTKEFNLATAINENLTLYVKLGEEITVIYGDIDDDGEVTMNDAIYLFNAAMFPDQYPIPSGQKTDYNGDGVFDMNDAIYLFNHAMFPDAFPI